VNAARTPVAPPAAPAPSAPATPGGGTKGPLVPGPWPRRKWWAFITLVFTVQLGLIFWLGERDAIRPRVAARAPALRLLDPAAPVPELVALADPTLFALPHRHGFSGPAWLETPTPENRPFLWVEPSGREAVDLQVDQLGAAFRRYMQTNHFAPVRPPAAPQPELFAPVVARAELLPDQSVLRITGQLASRRLLTQVELPSWPGQDPPRTELVSNSVVQIIVEASGRPVSTSLLASSGCKDADDYALAQARTMRFEALADGMAGTTASLLSGLSYGRLLFQWHTMAGPVTNLTPISP